MNATRSIHYRRRWYYGLWVALLLTSVIGLALWETPNRSSASKITLRLKVKNLPAHTKVMVWAGPQGRWPGSTWTGEGAITEINPAGEIFHFEKLALPVAYRRWGKNTIPRRTTDLVVLRFEAPGQAARYIPLPLGKDWRSGMLAPGWVMRLVIENEWEQLGIDSSAFSRLE